MDLVGWGGQNIFLFIIACITLGPIALGLGLILLAIVIGGIAALTGVIGSIPGGMVGGIIGSIVGSIRAKSMPKIGITTSLSKKS